MILMRRLCDIVVIMSGDLVYSDLNVRIVNIVKDGQIQEFIVIEEWKFYYICCMFFDDFFVIMIRNDEK